MNQAPDRQKDIALYRTLSLIAGVFYLCWWEAVHLLLPRAFNPLGSRVVVSSLFLLLFFGSLRSERIRGMIRPFFLGSLWVLTAHYFYLFYGNSGDSNWVIGCYITVTAISLCVFSNLAMFLYSLFVMVCAGTLVFFVPALASSVFLPGLVTILLQALVATRWRLSAIRVLEESNRRFQMLLNSTFEGILVHENGIVVDVNNALVRMTGFTKAELIGRSAFDIVAPEDRIRASSHVAKPETKPFEVVGLRKDGARVEIEVRAKNFEHEKKIYRLVTIQDISDRKSAEREKVRALAMTENIRARDEFISIASHEFKTPISALKLQTQMLEREIKREPNLTFTPVRMREILSVFDRQVDRLTKLVESMLDVSRISSGRLAFEMQKVNLSEIVRETVESLQYQYRAISLRAPAEAWVFGDPVRLQQMTENLLSNAIKYGSNKPIDVILEEREDSAHLSVSDQGIGIEPEATKRIFDRFERAVSSRNISGLGLGLYITRQIVEAHGGAIDVRSEIGRGSEFRVSLALAKS